MPQPLPIDLPPANVNPPPTTAPPLPGMVPIQFGMQRPLYTGNDYGDSPYQRIPLRYGVDLRDAELDPGISPTPGVSNNTRRGGNPFAGARGTYSAGSPRNPSRATQMLGEGMGGTSLDRGQHRISSREQNAINMWAVARPDPVNSMAGQSQETRGYLDEAAGTWNRPRGRKDGWDLGDTSVNAPPMTTQQLWDSVGGPLRVRRGQPYRRPIAANMRTTPALFGG